MASCFAESSFGDLSSSLLKCCCEFSDRIMGQARRMFAQLQSWAFMGSGVF